MNYEIREGGPPPPPAREGKHRELLDAVRGAGGEWVTVVGENAYLAGLAARINKGVLAGSSKGEFEARIHGNMMWARLDIKNKS